MYCTAVTLLGDCCALGFVPTGSPVLFVGEFLALNQSPGIFLKNVLCAAVFRLPLSSLLLLSVTVRRWTDTLHYLLTALISSWAWKGVDYNIPSCAFYQTWENSSPFNFHMLSNLPHRLGSFFIILPLPRCCGLESLLETSINKSLRKLRDARILMSHPLPHGQCSGILNHCCISSVR